MEVKVIPIGGYNEVGKNMTAVKVGDEVVILDMGFYLPKLVSFEEEGGNRRNLTPLGMKKAGIIPNDENLISLKDNVKAIISTHCHLDHIGAIPFLADRYKCPIIGTPYTLNVLETMLKDERIRLRNNLVDLNEGQTYQISKNLKVEFVNVTHSTIQCVMIALHTPEGIILYANDYKLDNNPVVGKAPDYKRLKNLSKKGILCLILDCLYSNSDMKTPSENVAREMLKDVMFGTDNTGHGMVVTTFASQLARLKSITEFGNKLDRKVVFLGRSLSKYVNSARDFVRYPNVDIVGYARQSEKKLKQIEKNRDRYLVVCTGNQAEPGAILTRMSTGSLNYKFKPEDHVIFSCKTIPVSPNIENRRDMEQRLKKRKVRLFLDIHSSGHGAREDNRDLIDLTKPKNIIPSHGAHSHVQGMVELAQEMGYTLGKNVHLADNGKPIILRR